MTGEGWDAAGPAAPRADAGHADAAPLMKPRGGGSIINTASIAGLQAGWGPMAYSTAKGAVIHLTVWRRRTGADKIRINAICPGLIATSIFGARRHAARCADNWPRMVAERAAVASRCRSPACQRTSPRAALYLASDDAAFVTGTHLVVDGGITIGGRHSWDPQAESPFAGIFGMEQRGAAGARGGQSAR